MSEKQSFGSRPEYAIRQKVCGQVYKHLLTCIFCCRRCEFAGKLLSSLSDLRQPFCIKTICKIYRVQYRYGGTGTLLVLPEMVRVRVSATVPVFKMKIRKKLKILYLINPFGCSHLVSCVPFRYRYITI
jgi:hypothetical protein